MASPQLPCLLAALLLGGFVGLPSCTSIYGSSEYNQLTNNRRFELEYEVVVPPSVSGNLGPVRIWVPVPITDRLQEVDVLESPEGVLWSSSDEHGNRSCSLVWQEGMPRSFTWRYRIERREDLLGFDAGEREMTESEVFQLYLDSDKLVPLRGPAAEVAFDLAQQMPRADLPAAIYQQILNDLEFSQEDGAGYGSSDFAVAEGRGDSADYTSYFISAMRSRQYAARFQIGFLLPLERGRGDLRETHAWGHWYRPGLGWSPVDLAEAERLPHRAEYFFGHASTNRVSMSYGRDLDLDPQQEAGQLNYFVTAYAEQDAREVELNTSVRYADL